MFWGPRFTTQENEQALKEAGLVYTKAENAAQLIADELALWTHVVTAGNIKVE